MNLSEVTPITRPDLYFLPRTVGVETVYDVDQEDISVSIGVKALRRRSECGISQVRFHDDRLELWELVEGETAPVLRAEARLVGEIWAGGAWQARAFTFAQAEISKLDARTFRAVVQKTISGIGIIFGQQMELSHGLCKHAFYLDAPGRLVRLKWQVRLHVPENAEGDGWRPKGVRYSIADYPGATDHVRVDNGDGTIDHQWTFEPSGKTCDAADGRTALQRYQAHAGLFVDPYLSVADQSTYWDVTCDGYNVRVYYGDQTTDIARIYEENVNIARLHANLYEDSVFYFNFDTSRVVTLLVNTPSFVALKIIGTLRSTGGGTALVDLDYISWYVYLYPRRMIIDCEISVSGDGIITSGTSPNNSLIRFLLESITGLLCYYSTNGSTETQATYSNSTTAIYHGGFETDQFDIVGAPLYIGNTPSNYLYVVNDWAICICYTPSTLSASTKYRQCWDYLFDASASQTNTIRLAWGNQCSDQAMTDPNPGVAVTGLTDPLSLGSSGFASDGAWHFDGRV